MDHRTASAEEEWDRRLLVHPGVAASDYVHERVVSAEGSWLTFSDGRRLLDFNSQYACNNLGHGHPRIREALHRAVDRMSHAVELFANDDRTRAAQLLLTETMEGSDWAGSVRFTSSGSEAVEAAMLFARLANRRPIIVTRQIAYHGWTEGAGSLTSAPASANLLEGGNHPAVLPPRSAAVSIGPPVISDERDVDGRLKCVVDTERHIRSVGVENVAAYVTELWCGALGYGVPEDYPRQVREMTKRLGILWIDDEVIAGMGRTGRWWAFQHYGVEPDLLVTAKALSSAAVPAGAVILARDVADRISRQVFHSYSTFSGHQLAMAAVAATIETMRDEKIVESTAKRGEYLARRLAEMKQRHPCVGRMQGRGFARALDLVRDARTGALWVPQDRWWTPTLDGQPDLFPGQYVAAACGRRGVLTFSFAPNTLMINPPLTISDEDLDLGLQAVDEALGELDDYNARHGGAA